MNLKSTHVKAPGLQKAGTRRWRKVLRRVLPAMLTLATRECVVITCVAGLPGSTAKRICSRQPIPLVPGVHNQFLLPAVATANRAAGLSLGSATGVGCRGRLQGSAAAA